MREEEVIVALVTAGSEEEGGRIARKLVEEKLAACVNILPAIRSIYRWEGEIQDEPEILLVIKTRRTLFDRLAARVRELHSYDTPEVIAFSVVAGEASYLDWLLRQTQA